ncbi:MAG TPA: squalene/phytoene synthase family protein [Candidatus Limnocylindria bacterium]|nr:squalene/phytoene synthase family protein [Candidatus Limnocylindria bacterium]
MPASIDSTDQRYCRAVLPSVSRTFALNIRLLSGTFGDSVRTAYLLCRAADALEDSWPVSGADAVRARFELFLAALNRDQDAPARLARDAASFARAGADLDLVAHLPRVLGAYRALPDANREAVREGVETLARGMCRFGARAAERPPDAPYLDTEEELRSYCFVVAGCVGLMLTSLFEIEHGLRSSHDSARRMALAPAVGEALQLTNILLDWPSDIRRGRCYLPASWLREMNLTPADLVGRDREDVRRLAVRLETMAFGALARVPDYLDGIPVRCVRYRLFCMWPAVWALASLRHARRSPEFPWGAKRPRMTRSQLLWGAVASVLVSPSSLLVRRLFQSARVSDLVSDSPVARLDTIGLK